MEDADVQDVTETIEVSSEGTISEDLLHPSEDEEEMNTRKRGRSPTIEVLQPTIPKKIRTQVTA